MGIKLNLRKVNTAWVNVFEREKDRENDDGSITKGQYSATIILPSDHAQIDALYDTVYAVVEEALGAASAEKWMKSNYGEGKHMDKCAIKDIAERDNPFEDFPEGFYFKAKAQKQPLIVTSKKGETQVEQDFNVDGEQIEGEQVYSGCVANVSVEIWFSQKYKVLGVNCWRLNTSVKVKRSAVLKSPQASMTWKTTKKRKHRAANVAAANI